MASTVDCLMFYVRRALAASFQFGAAARRKRTRLPRHMRIPRWLKGWCEVRQRVVHVWVQTEKEKRRRRAETKTARERERERSWRKKKRKAHREEEEEAEGWRGWKERNKEERLNFKSPLRGPGLKFRTFIFSSKNYSGGRERKKVACYYIDGPRKVVIYDFDLHCGKIRRLDRARAAAGKKTQSQKLHSHCVARAKRLSTWFSWRHYIWISLTNVLEGPRYAS